MRFVHELLEVVAGGGAALGLRLLVPLAPAVGSSYPRFNLAVFPCSAVVEDGGLETGLQLRVRRFCRGGAVPGAPIGEAAGGKFIRLHNLLSGSAVSAALLAHEFVVSAGGVVEVEIVGEAVGVGEAVLEDAFFVACLHSLGERVCVVGLKGVSELLQFVCGLYYLVPTLGVEHGACNEGEGHALVQPAGGFCLFRQQGSGCAEVVKDEVPGFRLGGKGFVYGYLSKVFIVDDDIFVALYQLEVEPAPHQAQLAVQARLYLLRQACAQRLEVGNGLRSSSSRGKRSRSWL